MRRSNAPSRRSTSPPPGTQTQSKNVFSIHAKNFFFTWPQNDFDKQLALENIKHLFGDSLDGAVVCQEKHQDGTDHLHAIVTCKNAKKFLGQTGLRKLDQLTGKHGNYQTARNWRKVLQYVCKDGNYIAHNLDVEVVLRALASKRGVSWETTAKEIIEKKMDLEMLYKEKPGFLLQYRQKAEGFIELRDRFEETSLTPYNGLQINSPEYPSARIIDLWLEKNLRKPRQIRQKQLWIYGDPDVGKTRLKCELMDRFKVFIKSVNIFAFLLQELEKQAKNICLDYELNKENKEKQLDELINKLINSVNK